MKLAYGISALLLGTALAGGAAVAQNYHPHFTGHHHVSPSGAHGNPNGGAPPSGNPSGSWHGNGNGNAAPNGAPNNGPSGNANSGAAGLPTPMGWAASHNGHGAPNGNGGNNSWHGHASFWGSGNSFGDRNVAHFSPQQRTTWQHGNWNHGYHHGRYGWWWYSGGGWFFYNTPVYPYPGYVSNYYYPDDYAYDGYDGGYAGDYGPAYASDPRSGGYSWYYCNNPAGYYPYVKSCHGPWRAVTPTPQQDQQQGYDQGPNGGDEQGPPPGYDDNGPGPDQQGYNDNRAPRGDQLNGPQNGDDRGPPPSYNNGNGPNNDDEDDDNGPPPSQSPR